MNLALVGFSGTGKSHWAKELSSQLAYTCFCCDDLIEERLGPEAGVLGPRRTRRLQRWLGYPFEHRYPHNEARYLELESKILEEILDKEIPRQRSERLVIDTTGSVIYVRPDLLQRLKDNLCVIYLEAPPETMQNMYQQFFTDPKPLIWKEMFQVGKGEDPREALKRCYPRLMESRRESYEKLAHHTLDYRRVRSEEFDGQAFLTKIEKESRQ